MVAHCCQGIAQGEGAWLSDCAEEEGYYPLHLRGEMERAKAYEGGPRLCQREREKVDERSLDQRHRGWKEGEALPWCWRSRGGQLSLLLSTSCLKGVRNVYEQRKHRMGEILI